VAKKYLEDRGEQFQEVDVALDHQAAEEMIEISGQYGVPVITVDDQVVIGFDQVKLERLLASA
jgi:alkyl hydroperoxide reductase subunit F